MDAWDRKLTWVQRNRKRKHLALRIAEVMPAVVHLLEQDLRSPLGQVAEYLGRMATDDLAGHCRVAGLEARTLRINVDQPARVSWMRARWQTPILRALSSHATFRVDHCLGFYMPPTAHRLSPRN